MKNFCHNGFTLVELLVVVVIVGIMAMMLGPTFTTGSDIARVKTAARGVMQMSRYARTMAVLHQMPVVLVFSADGTIRVESAVASPQGGNGASDGAVTSDVSDKSDSSDKPAMESGEGKAYVMADLEAEKSYAQVLFEVTLDDDDGADQESAAKGFFEEQEKEKGFDSDEAVTVVKTVRVHYESNGRCFPYRVVVRATGDDIGNSLTVVIDRFGVARVLEDDR
ncbi:MAG: prepilin-type N-terminal cleavage/methylation domain-containing protein [Kiritimatiellae bacterium]|nr:prepilin-type N-terminal cleavage/methylation domain-containing protein [Kiritimatiellia bacterium]